MKKHLLFFVFIYLFLPFLGLGGFLFAQKKLTVTESKIGFVIKNAGFNVNGTFSGFEANIEVDKQGNPSLIEASVQTNTVNTNNNARDRHLKKDDYFDAEKYPKIEMKAKKFNYIGKNPKTGEYDYKGTFDLTIKGITKTFEIPFTFSGTVFKSEFVINRRDFGVGSGSLILANNVKMILMINVK